MVPYKGSFPRTLITEHVILNRDLPNPVREMELPQLFSDEFWQVFLYWMIWRLEGKPDEPDYGERR
jgi:hypothetical protein